MALDEALAALAVRGGEVEAASIAGELAIGVHRCGFLSPPQPSVPLARLVGASQDAPFGSVLHFVILDLGLRV